MTKLSLKHNRYTQSVWSRKRLSNALGRTAKCKAKFLPGGLCGAWRFGEKPGFISRKVAKRRKDRKQV